MIASDLRPDIEALSALLSTESFTPSQPRNLADTGLSDTMVDNLICIHLLVLGMDSGRSIAENICLPYGIVEERLGKLRMRQILTPRGAAALNDHVYALTDQGREFAQAAHAHCAYLGPAPVPLTDYVTSVDAQTITAECPRRRQLEEAFTGISVNPEMFSRLGPAINSGAGLFLYGAPGNGKTTLAERITLCFGQEIWVPKALFVDGDIVKFFDPAYHVPRRSQASELLKEDCHDARWVKVRRPTVVVGGELTMDSLEIRHNPHTHVSEAPLQLKSNCGTLLIDDFGRQRMDPFELLNRWIVPLEKRYDFLTLGSGKKIQVPFDQLIIFSTNIEPSDLVDEAFLRRIPYKVHVQDPDEREFHRLFALSAPLVGCEYHSEAVEYLLATHYRPKQRPLRRCHPRDLLLQIHHYCAYNDLPMEMKPEYFDRVVEDYFTVVGARTGWRDQKGGPSGQAASGGPQA
jgi:predicted ATPase with chaperone activity